MLGKLFCDACREPLSLKKSVIALHLKSAKHTSGVERIESKQRREKNIVDLLNKYDQEVHPVGEGLPDTVRVYRLKVLSCFMKADVAISKVDCFREILEESSFRLTSSRHLTEMIPVIHREEEEKLHREISGRNVSIVFDGTTHVCEAMVIVVRFNKV